MIDERQAVGTWLIGGSVNSGPDKSPDKLSGLDLLAEVSTRVPSVVQLDSEPPS